MIFVLAGSSAQFMNFAHLFNSGNLLREVKAEDKDLLEMVGEGRVIVLLIGTWYEHPLRDKVINYCQSKDSGGRPRGQTFAMFGARK